MLDNYDDYKTGGTHKVFSISVVGENITITNENLRTESIVLDEELCSSTNLKFGSCGTSKFTAEIANVFENFEGKLINVTVTMDNEVTKYGTFKVFSDKPIADRIFRSLTAYDAMNDIIKTNVLSWYNSLTFPMTLKNFRDSFFNYLGITQETTTLVNDNFIIPGGFTASDSLMGGTIITAICELNGVFGHINRDGKFEYIDLTQSESFDCPPYENGSVTYEDYVTSPITKVTMRGTASDVGTSVGVAGNEYIIQGNPLIYGTEGTQALTTAITNLLNKIKTIVFRPFDLRKTIGNPCVEIGDAITIDTKYETVTSYILRRTLTGIQALRDRYSASGSRVYPAVATSYSNEITRTQGKIHEVEVSLDEFRSEVSQTYVTQTAYNSKIQELQDEIDGAIESFTGSAVPTLNNYPASDWTTTTEKDKHIGDLYQVNSQGGSYAGFYYRFDKTNNVYSWVHIPDNEVQKALADAAEANEKAEAAQATADGIATNLSTNYSTTQQMNSAINQKATEIELAVSQTYATQQTVTNVKNSTIKSDVLHYLATSAGSGVTRSTPGWSTTPQSMTSTNQYLWTYHTYTYGDDHTSDTDPIITGRYGQNGSQGPQGETGPQGPQGEKGDTGDTGAQGPQGNKGDKGDKGDTGDTGAQGPQGNPGTNGISIVEVVPLYYASNSTTAPAAPTSNVTRTDTATGVWTRGIPALTSTYKYMYTCDQVKYSNNTYTWTSVVLDNSLTNLTERMTQAELDLQPASITAKVSSTNTFTTLQQHTALEGRVNSRNYFLYFRSDKRAASTVAFRSFPTSGEFTLDDYQNTGSFTQFGNLSAPMSYFLNKPLRISFDAISPNGATGLKVYNTNSAPRYSIGQTDVSPALTTSWQHYSISLTVTDNGASGTNENASNKIEFYAWAQKGVKIRNVKLEMNEVETDWCYAPEDYANNTEAQGYANTAQTQAVATAKSYTDSQIQVSASGILSTVEQGYTTKTEFGNLQIGGRNLIRDTEIPADAGEWNTSLVPYDSIGWYIYNATKLSVQRTTDGIKYTHVNDTTYSGFAMMLADYDAVGGNEKITISFQYKTNLTSVGVPYLLISNKSTASGNVAYSGSLPALVPSSSEWKTYKATFSFPASTGRVFSGFMPIYFNVANGWIEIKDRSMKLEKGDKATDWSPALEDITAPGINLMRYAPTNKASASYQAYQIPITEKLNESSTYTLQLWNVDVSHTGKTSSQLNVCAYAGGGMVKLCQFDVPTGHSDYLTATFTVTAGNNASQLNNLWLNFYNSVPSAAGTMNLTIGAWKLEKGNKATEWQMNPIDVSSKSEVTQLSNMVAVKVNSSGRLVTAALGVDPASATSYVKVKADDIDIISNGNIQLTGKSIGISSTNFSVTAAGVVTCSNITATGGKIGDWDIVSDGLSKTSGTYTATLYPFQIQISNGNSLATLSSHSLNVDNIETLQFHCGYIITEQPFKTKFNIDSNGNVDAAGTGLFSGILTASAGLKTNTISSNSGSTVTINNAMTVKSNGKVSTTNDITSGGELISGYGIELGMASANAAALIDFHWASNNTDFTARIWQRGENTVDLIGKNSSTWGIWRAASFNSQSSKYVKKNIKDVTEKEARNILKLRPVKFDYKNSDLTNQRGLIAEEVLEIMPEMVNVPKDYTGFNKDEPWNTPSIDYSKFVPYLIKMIQIQQKQIDDLKK